MLDIYNIQSQNSTMKARIMELIEMTKEFRRDQNQLHMVLFLSS